MAEFNFIESYKLLQPATDRAVVDLRKSGFDQIVKSITWGQIVDLGRLAFNLPYDAAVYAEWFQKPLHDADPHFFVAQDAAEAGRIAVLVLRHFVAQGQTATTAALIALASSYAGKRPALDNGELVTRSRDVIAASSKKAAMTAPSAKIGIPKAADHSAKKTEMTNAFDAPRTAALAEALVQDLRTGSEAAVTALSDAYLALRQDNLRLAEEIDMLWWHVGDWSNALDIPRTSISKKSVGLVSGVDLGAMVKFSPGPYGAYGILKHSLGKEGEETTSLVEAVAGLDASQLARLKLDSAPDVFPVLTALRLASANRDWAGQFAKMAPDAAGEKLTHLELATQAFRERVSMTNVGLV
ncbi:GTPase-associated system all-helical protein GASH [Bradyrhizobium elkanii]|uniref:GTPase-associated system all-helical protein GASH n=1 Tax=Bradyrhizobium elkanii TaxID=29448 RepID=UPI00209F4825|nr:GTPase-associated system all-helical protein GASH [Bradyrhizobium elkanii]MCP1968465.1 hypothetical protein [Bradyrhizobium elkanii]MCS4110035.1 hypothetical protein [Bradyrhizobium elkanii]